MKIKNNCVFSDTVNNVTGNRNITNMWKNILSPCLIHHLILLISFSNLIIEHDQCSALSLVYIYFLSTSLGNHRPLLLQVPHAYLFLKSQIYFIPDKNAFQISLNNAETNIILFQKYSLKISTDIYCSFFLCILYTRVYVYVSI